MRRFSKFNQYEIPTCLLKHIHIPKRILIAFLLVYQEIENFSLDSLILEISFRRGKKIVIKRILMPNRIIGYIIALKDVDLICIQENIDDYQFIIAVLHELGHILCKHVPRYCKGDKTPTYKEFIQSNSTKYALCRITNSHRRTMREYDAETMATLLYKAIYEHENTPKNITKMLYDH